MNCSVNQLISTEEILWFVSVGVEDIEELIVQFAAFEHQKLTRICFRDKLTNHEVCIEHAQKGKRKSNDGNISLLIEDYPIFDAQDWFGAVFSLLLDIKLLGWNQVDHVDYDFSQDGKDISVAFYVKPPT